MTDAVDNIDYSAVERYIGESPERREAFIEGMRQTFNGRNHPHFLTLCAGAALCIKLKVSDPDDPPQTGDEEFDAMAAGIHRSLLASLRGKPPVVIDCYLEAIRRELNAQGLDFEYERFN